MPATLPSPIRRRSMRCLPVCPPPPPLLRPTRLIHTSATATPSISCPIHSRIRPNTSPLISPMCPHSPRIRISTCTTQCWHPVATSSSGGWVTLCCCTASARHSLPLPGDRMLLTDVRHALLDALFPPRCLHCGAVGAVLCSTYLASAHAPAPPLCPRCGRSLPAGSRADAVACPTCISGRGPKALTTLRTAAIYE